MTTLELLEEVTRLQKHIKVLIKENNDLIEENAQVRALHTRHSAVWPPEKTSHLVRMVKEGKTAKQIGKKLGVTMPQVYRRVRQLDLTAQLVKCRHKAWTTKDIKNLIEARDSGKDFAEIAKENGHTAIANNVMYNRKKKET